MMIKRKSSRRPNLEYLHKIAILSHAASYVYETVVYVPYVTGSRILIQIKTIKEIAWFELVHFSSFPVSLKPVKGL